MALHPDETGTGPDGADSSLAGAETTVAPMVPVVPAPWPNSRLRRIFDIVVSVVLLPAVALIGIVASLGSVFVFRTWPLFVQTRRGRGERPFTTLKIRSLERSFPLNQGKLGLDVSDQGRWSRALRRSHVDELPQVLNVLAGSMSIVGPRPMIDEVLEHVNPADRRVRALVKPGMTGAWQVSEAGARSLHSCTELDTAYVSRSSFRTDLTIIGWTVRVMVRRRAMPVDDVCDGLGR